MIPIEKIRSAGYSDECIAFYEAFEGVRAIAQANGNMVHFNKLLMMSTAIFSPPFTLSRRGVAGRNDVKVLANLLHRSIKPLPNVLPDTRKVVVSNVVSGGINGAKSPIATPECPTCPQPNGKSNMVTNEPTQVAVSPSLSSNQKIVNKPQLEPFVEPLTEVIDNSVLESAFEPSAAIKARSTPLDMDVSSISEIMNTDEELDYPHEFEEEETFEEEAENRGVVEQVQANVSEKSELEEKLNPVIVEHGSQPVNSLDDCKSWEDVKEYFTKGGTVHYSTATMDMRTVLKASGIKFDKRMARKSNELAKLIYSKIVMD